MPHDVHAWFLVKEAEEESEKDSLIDPGEAAAAGLAFAAGPLVTRVLPAATGAAMQAISPKRQYWKGAPFYGVKTPVSFLEDTFQAGEKKFKALKPTLEAQGVAKGDLRALAEQLIGDLDSKHYPQGEEARKYVKSVVDPIERLHKEQLAAHNPKRSMLGGLFKVGPSKREVPYYADRLKSLIDSSDAVQSMMEKYKLGEKGVRFDLTPGPLSEITGPSYNKVTNRVKLPWVNEEVILHELGHAAHMGGSRTAKVLDAARNFIHRGTNLAIPMAYIAGNEIRKMFPGTVDDKVIDFVQQNAPAISAATYAAADIYPEIRATEAAVRHVHQTQGRKAALSTLKKLLPPLGTYVLPIIPSIIGISMAKKYFNEAEQARKEKEQFFQKIDPEETEKVASILKGLWPDIAVAGRDLGHILSQVGRQTKGLFAKEPAEVGRKLLDAGKNVLKSPEFGFGAAYAGIPAATAAYVLHNMPHGKIYTKRLPDIKTGLGWQSKAQAQVQKEEAEAKEKSFAFPVIAGATAAISGGLLTKLFSDLGKVL